MALGTFGRLGQFCGGKLEAAGSAAGRLDQSFVSGMLETTEKMQQVIRNRLGDSSWTRAI
jgi:hypothetical protein